MNSGARRSPPSVPHTDGEHTTHISTEKISALKAACVEESTVLHQPNSLSGMVASLTEAPETEGPFTTVSELSSGSTATVFLALDNRDDAVERIVAVKHYLSSFTERRDFAPQFIQEMSLARAVDHPSVCKLLDYGRTGSSYYSATEFVQGEPLSKVLAAPAFLNLSNRSPRLIAHLVANFAEGLHAIHTLHTARGPAEAVHEEVTAENLFVLYDGHVRVMNFGTAWIRELGPQQTAADKSYLAPEQLEQRGFDARVDIWALGVILWELLAGRKLFRCNTKREAVVEITARRISPPSDHNSQVTAELDRIVLKALARNPSKRYASARELSADLEACITESGGAVPPVAIADWLTQLVPTGAERCRGLLEMAAAARPPLPSFPISDDEAAPDSRAYTPAAQDEVEHTTHIFLPKPTAATLRSLDQSQMTVSYKDMVPPTLRLPRRGARRSWRATLLPFGAAFAIVLGGFLAGHSMFSRARLSRSAAAATTGFEGPRAAAAAVTDLSQRTTAVEAPSVVSTAASPLLEVAPAPAPSTQTTPVVPTPAPSAAVAPKVASRKDTSPTRSATKAAPAVNTASSPPTQLGSVYVSTPGGGQVFEGGRNLGHAPGQFELSPGWHTLVVKSGDDTRTVTMQVPVGSGIMVSVPPTKH